MKNREDFKEYIEAFLKQNSYLNLISKNDEKFLWEKHIFDSLAIGKFFEKYFSKDFLEDRKIGGLEDRLFNDSSLSETLKHQLTDNSLTSYLPIFQPSEINPSTDNNFPLSTFHFQLLDIGTGGGFPAVPIAIMYPEIEVFALDSIRKKINAIENIKAELGLKNLHTICDRAENIVECKKVKGLESVLEGKRVGSSEGKLINKSSLGKISQELQFDNSLPSYPPALLPSNNNNIRETLQVQHSDNIPSYLPTLLPSKFDLITSRAVAPIKVIVEYAMPLLKNDGYFIAYKSIKAQEEIEEAKQTLKKHKAKVVDIIRYDLPLKENFTRNLVVIKRY